MTDPPDRRRLGPEALAALASIAVRVEGARRLEPSGGEAVLRSIVEATVTLFDAHAASIALYDAATDRLVFRVAAGEQGQGVIGLSIAPDQGLVGYVYTTGQALAISDVLRDARFGRSFAEQTAYVPKSIAAVPLLDDHGSLGVLEVLDKRDQASFDLRDIELASVFARQATVAIRASRVERDAGALLRTVIERLTDPDASPDAVEEIVEAVTADLDRDDDTRLWALVEQIARVRAADPAQLELVTDLLGVLAQHTERNARLGRRGR